MNMARKFMAVTNRRKKNQFVQVDSLVWVAAETVMPGVSSKLRAHLIGPYKVKESIRDDSAYIVVNVF